MPSPTARGLKMCEAPPAATMTALARNTQKPPGRPTAFPESARFENVRGPPSRNDDCFGAEYAEVPGPHVETDGAGDAIGSSVVHQQMRHHDAIVDFVGRLAGRLRDDRLIALAVDHDLPFA